MKRHILLAPTFSSEEVWNWARRGAERDPACGCWENVSWSKNHICAYAHTYKRRDCFASTRADIHASLAGNDGLCAWNSSTLCRPLPPLHNLSLGIGRGSLTFQLSLGKRKKKKRPNMWCTYRLSSEVYCTYNIAKQMPSQTTLSVFPAFRQTT